MPRFTKLENKKCCSNSLSPLSVKLRHKWVRFLTVLFFSFSITVVCSIALKLTIAGKQTPIPQAILTLGGGADREKFTAQIARAYPNLPIWVSSGLPPKQA